MPKQATKSNGAVGAPIKSLGEVLDFMRLLWAVDHGLQSRSKRMEAVLGVTGPQRLVIRLVGQRPGISAGELAALLHVHPSTLTGVLGRLEARGVVARRPDPNDKRRALLSLTSKGQKLDKVRAGTVEARLKPTLARLSAQRVRAAREVLAAVAEALDEAPGETARPRRDVASA
ncbi:MAG TPA: MarR family transcriptional regulator [Minicystis sp.]|nr:MarR family transcriptional regulator [Minicystis sp.]